jgi:hypothetical protein
MAAMRLAHRLAPIAAMVAPTLDRMAAMRFTRFGARSADRTATA